MAEPGAGFDSRGIGLRAQKKLLGKMSSKKIAMSFIDETTGRVLDNAHKILRQYLESKKEADKVLKYIIKSVVKVDFTYDKAFIRSSLEECRQLLQSIIERHLTDKSKSRVDLVFNTFSKPELLDAVFTDKSYKFLMGTVVADLNTLMDEGSL